MRECSTKHLEHKSFSTTTKKHPEFAACCCFRAVFTWNILHDIDFIKVYLKPSHQNCS